MSINHAALPILAYCSASIGMTLINKYVLSSFPFKLPFLILAAQAITSVSLLEGFTLAGLTKHRPLNRRDAQHWIPVAILMAVMLYTGSKSLQYLAVPFFTIFKNLSIILVAYGERFVFGTRVTTLMLFSFLLMVFSSALAAGGDISSAGRRKDSSENLVTGYIWMVCNCIASASFVVFMRYTMKNAPAGHVPFKDFDTVFYNNILTAPIFLLFSLAGQDGSLSDFWSYYVESENYLERNTFLFAILLSGVAGFWISYASAWCMRVTNSTTYSMVGALNKLPISIAGLLFFADSEINVSSVGSIVVGVASGLLYTFAKIRQVEEEKILRPPAENGGKKANFGSERGNEEELVVLTGSQMMSMEEESGKQSEAFLSHVQIDSKRN